MKPNCPPEIVLEGLWLTGQASEEIKSHVNSCRLCQERTKGLEEERKDFLQKHPFESFWRMVVEKRSLLSRIWQIIYTPIPIWKPAVSFALLACLFVAVLLTRDNVPLILPKGGANFGYYVSHLGEVNRGRDEMRLSSGDKLMFFYSAKKQGYLLLIGVEADGTLTIYYPFNGERSGQILRGNKVFLPGAIEWTPHSPYERFYALFSDGPISAQELKNDIVGQISEGREVKDIKKLPAARDQKSFILYQKENS